MKIKKIITITILIIIVLSSNIFAGGIGEIFDIAESWTEVGQQHTNTTMDSSKLIKGSTQFYNILLLVGTAVVVIVGAILGIQYMTAGIEEKAKVKESLIPYLISCIVIFGSLGIWKLAVTVLKEI